MCTVHRVLSGIYRDQLKAIKEEEKNWLLLLLEVESTWYFSINVKFVYLLHKNQLKLANWKKFKIWK